MVDGDAAALEAVVHNLEHGAVALWIDPSAVSTETTSAFMDWATSLNEAGFQGRAGAGILVSPAPEGLEVAPVSLRAWGVALDCERWNAETATRFVESFYGTRGQAPERELAPYPDGATG